jgi:pyruvate formate lyase activating enzyme
MAKEAMLYEPAKHGKLHCFLCNHHCKIADSKFGFCGVRQNQNGTLVTFAYGKVIAANVDPIEKKPLYHFFPGSLSFSIATAGCNFHCGFCQNWQISQISQRDGHGMPGHEFSPQELVAQAKARKCRSIAYTYTEPTIFFEYAYDTAELAKEEGLRNVFVTNGFMTSRALEKIRPYLDACNVDLKSFRDDFYKKTCSGRLKPVLESIRRMKKLGIWVEVTTLVVPDQNDSESELRDIASFIAGLDQGIPWHISRFHPDYEFGDARPTPLETLKMAYSIGKDAMLEHIYIGNVPGEGSDTVCPRCHEVVIRRGALGVKENRLKDSSCPSCGSVVAGVFE